MGASSRRPVEVPLTTQDPVSILVVGDPAPELESALADLGASLVHPPADAALQRALEGDFASILLDAGGAGLELAERIRRGGRKTPILFLDAGDGFPADRAYSLGSVDHLSRPFSPVALRAKLSPFLARPGRAEDRAVDPGDATELWKMTLASIGDGVIATDVEGRVTFLNPVAEQLTGWPLEDARGVPLTVVFNIVNETTREPVANPALRALKTGAIVGLANHTILISRQGAEYPIDDSAAPIRRGGRVGGAVLVFRDISERKAAEAELARAHEETARQKRLYETILSATPDFVYVFSLDHKVLYANDSLIAMWGRGREGAIGRTFLEIGYPGWHAEMHDREIDQVRATKRPIRGEVPFHGTLGRRIYDYIFVPVFGPDGEVEAVAGTTRDVTDRKAGEEKLRLLDAMGEAVRPAADPVAVLEATTRLLGEHLGVTRIAYADVEADGDRFTIRHDWRGEGAESTVGTYSLDAFGPRAAADQRAGRTLVVRDADAELAPAEGGDAFNAIGIKAVVCCPLVKDGRLVAMMAAHQDAPRDWTPAEVALVEEVVERSWAHIERVGAAAAVRESNDRFAIVARATNDAVWDWDMRTDAVWWNEGVLSLFGYRREDVGADASWWYDHIHPDDRERIVSGIHAAIDHGGTNWSDEYRFRRGDGRYAIILDRGYAIHEGGKTIRLVGAMQDVTERRRIEERLREGEKQYRELFESIDEGFCVVEVMFDGEEAVDYRFLKVNPVFERQTGLRDAVGRRMRELAPSHDGHWLEICGRVASTGEPVRSQEYDRALGRHFDVFAFRTGDPASNHVAVLFHDVTQRKRAEESVQFLADASASLAELVDYQTTLNRIANLAVAGFADWCVVDMIGEDGRRERLAVTASEAEEAASARRADAAFLPTDGVAEMVPHVLRTGEPEVVFDLAQADPATAPQGPKRLARLREIGVRSYLCVPLRSRGRVIGGMTFLSSSALRRFGPDELRIAQNLAERVTVAIENAQLYRSLQEQDRRKDEFLATLAHELRNPLAPVRNGLQILRMGGADVEGAGKTLSMMDRQLRHITHLVDDLMDVARVSSGKVALRMERVPLRAIIDSAVETSRQAIEAGDHEFALKLPREELPVEADRTRMVQVLANLLNNAAKYTPPEGRIVLVVKREGRSAVVRVSDTGVGIPPEMLPKVFEMFTQVGTSLERSQGGLGIGLTLVKRLVEMHGGSVFAESAGPGQGSTFTVRLPLAAEADPSEAGPPSSVDGAAGLLLDILVVDDNRDSADTLAHLLAIQGHRVKTAYDGPEALRLLANYRPQLILLDLGLPGMSGYEVAHRIRESTALRGVTLAALTGWGQDEDRRRTHEAGFDHHLVKPADPDEIARIIAGVKL